MFISEQFSVRNYQSHCVEVFPSRSMNLLPLDIEDTRIQLRFTHPIQDGKQMVLKMSQKEALKLGRELIEYGERKIIGKDTEN